MRLRGVKLPRVRKFEASLKTTSGTKVRSSYEQVCADLLTQNRIGFQYEPLILIGGRQFRPDFYLPEQNLFVEICGYDHMPHYRDRTEFKKQLYAHNNLKAVFIHYGGDGSLADLLITEFARYGLTIHKINTG